MKKYIGSAPVEKRVGEIVQQLYESGSDNGERAMLGYTMSGIGFLGAGHGMVGIYYMLLKALKLATDGGELEIPAVVKESLRLSCHKLVTL